MQKLKRIGLASMAVVLAATAVSGLRAQTMKVGVFDPQVVSETTEAGRSVQAELTAFRDRKQAEISGKEKAIGDLQQQLRQQELSLSSDRRTKMERDIQRQLLDLQSAREAATRELQLEIGSAQSSFEEKLIQAVRTFGKEQGYTLVLDRSLVAWSDSAIDVTDQVVQRFNQMFPVTSE